MYLEAYLKKRKQQKDILLMTHIVLGYPSFEINREVIRQMVENGVDCVELQIPFSEPMADGPVILKANQDSIAGGTTIGKCLEFAAEMVNTYEIPFLYMTYFNIAFKYGELSFISQAAQSGIAGMIIPDLPPEEGTRFIDAARSHHIAPIQIYAPTTSDQRMRELNEHAAGFIYCTARKGVTGKQSQFGSDFSTYLSRCRQATNLPLAVGFGIQSRADVQELTGQADIAVVGSRTITLVDQEGSEQVGPFIRQLQDN